MKKAAIAAFFVLFFAFTASAQTEWVKYTSADGRYSVSLPGKPVISQQEAPNKSGDKFTQHLAQLVSGNEVFTLAYFDLGSRTYSLDLGRDGMVAALNGKLISEKAISLGGSPGRQILIAAAIGDTDYTFVAKFYQVSDRVYILAYGFPKADAGAGNDARSDKFFDSFAVAK